jgi:hypothetical protein
LNEVMVPLNVVTGVKLTSSVEGFTCWATKSTNGMKHFFCGVSTNFLHPVKIRKKRKNNSKFLI